MRAGGAFFLSVTRPIDALKRIFPNSAGILLSISGYFVFSFQDALTVRYFRFNLMRGHETAGVPLTAADLDPLAALEEIARRPGLSVAFDMERGDMQFVNNRFILHSRTAFEDYAEPERRRYFLRLWMRYRD